MNFEAIIGLEIHIQLNTKSKMFSSSPVGFGEKANTSISSFDMGFPGTMPTVNKEAVRRAIKMCHALHMNIDHELWFDRKNYFYSDLPKGYQISQHYRPIGTNGYLDIQIDKQTKRINFERLQIEEDACKQVHFDNYTSVDYNRAGIPLLELVTKPEFSNGYEAMKFVETIRSIIETLNIGTGRMEEGSLRCDVNVSLKPYGYDVLGSKVEIKNVNTLVNIEKAIDYEIERQTKLLYLGKSVKQETKRFDEHNKKTVSMREKVDDVDYKYFVDCNIPPIKLSDDFIKEVISEADYLLENKNLKYQSLGIKKALVDQLVKEKELAKYFDELISLGGDPSICANWVLVEVKSVLNRLKISIIDFPIKPTELIKIINSVKDGIISNSVAKEIFNVVLNNHKISIDQLIQENSQINNEDELLKIIRTIIMDNPSSFHDYQQGKNRALGFLVAQVLKYTNGRANPSIVNRLMIKELEVK